MLDHIPRLGDSVVSGLLVVLHAQLHVLLEHAPDLVPHGVNGDGAADLHDEDDAEEDGEGDGHALVLLDGAAAAEEGHDEDEEAHADDQEGRVQEVVAQEVQVLPVRALDHGAGDDQHQTGQLLKKNK